MLALYLSLSSLTACAFNDSTRTTNKYLPVVQIHVGKIAVNAELANNAETRRIGLMNRRALPNNTGMLFVFDNSTTQCMWMQNTLMDLDVAFFDDKQQILNIATMKAGTTDIHCSQGNSPIALEMQAGWFERNKISAGKFLKIPISNHAKVENQKE